MAADRKAGAQLALAAMMLLLVALLWAAVDSGRSAAMDRSVLLGMAGGPVRAWTLVTMTGDTATRAALACAIALWLLLRRRRGDALFLLVAVAGGIGVNEAAKALFDRPRPDLLPHLDHVGVLSFPSGHAAGAAVLGAALATMAGGRRAWALAGGYALAVGTSRLALAVHWPTDVAAGWCLGLAWVLMLRSAVPRDPRRRLTAPYRSSC